MTAAGRPASCRSHRRLGLPWSGPKTRDPTRSAVASARTSVCGPTSRQMNSFARSFIIVSIVIETSSRSPTGKRSCIAVGMCWTQGVARFPGATLWCVSGSVRRLCETLPTIRGHAGMAVNLPPIERKPNDAGDYFCAPPLAPRR